MTDLTGHKNRPGAGPYSSDMLIDGIPLNHYINDNPTTGRAEIVKPMPPGTDDVLVKDFANRPAAWEWAKNEFGAGRLP